MTKKNSEFSRLLAEFLTIYLPYQRGYSKNTILSYRDTFKQILLYFSAKNIKSNKITLDKFNKDSVIDFFKLDKSRT